MPLRPTKTTAVSSQVLRVVRVFAAVDGTYYSRNIFPFLLNSVFSNYSLNGYIFENVNCIKLLLLKFAKGVCTFNQA